MSGYSDPSVLEFFKDTAKGNAKLATPGPEVTLTLCTKGRKLGGASAHKGTDVQVVFDPRLWLYSVKL
jgi:hypothetical protein